MAKNPPPPLLIPKETGSPIYYSYGTQVCLHCPLAPEYCEESEIIPGNARKTTCLISFTTAHRIPLSQADQVALMTIARGMSARAFRRTIELMAEREQFLQSIKDKRRQQDGNGAGSVDVNRSGTVQRVADRAARAGAGAGG